MCKKTKIIKRKSLSPGYYDRVLLIYDRGPAAMRVAVARAPRQGNGRGRVGDLSAGCYSFAGGHAKRYGDVSFCYYRQTFMSIRPRERTYSLSTETSADHRRETGP